MPLITPHLLSQNIATHLQCGEKLASHYANLIMDIFGFQDRIIDNILNTQERKLFYKLETCGILSSCREDTRLPDGRQWRIHYWRLLQPNSIPKIHQKKIIPKKKTTGIYQAIPEDLWSRRQSNIVS